MTASPFKVKFGLKVMGGVAAAGVLTLATTVWNLGNALTINETGCVIDRVAGGDIAIGGPAAVATSITLGKASATTCTVSVVDTTEATVGGAGALKVAGGIYVTKALFGGSTATFATSVSTPSLINGTSGVTFGQATTASQFVMQALVDEVFLIKSLGTQAGAYLSFEKTATSKSWEFGMNNTSPAGTDGLFFLYNGTTYTGACSPAGAWTFPVSISSPSYINGSSGVNIGINNTDNENYLYGNLRLVNTSVTANTRRLLMMKGNNTSTTRTSSDDAGCDITLWNTATGAGTFNSITSWDGAGTPVASIVFNHGADADNRGTIEFYTRNTATTTLIGSGDYLGAWTFPVSISSPSYINGTNGVNIGNASTLLGNTLTTAYNEVLTLTRVNTDAALGGRIVFKNTATAAATNYTTFLGYSGSARVRAFCIEAVGGAIGDEIMVGTPTGQLAIGPTGAASTPMLHTFNAGTLVGANVIVKANIGGTVNNVAAFTCGKAECSLGIVYDRSDGTKHIYTDGTMYFDYITATNTLTSPFSSMAGYLNAGSYLSTGYWYFGNDGQLAGYPPSASPQHVFNGLNQVVDSSGNVLIRVTNALAADQGGQLCFSAEGSSAHANYPLAGISGRKANSDSGNYKGYLSLLTSTQGGALTERVRIDDTGLFSALNNVAHVFGSAATATSTSISIRCGAALSASLNFIHDATTLGQIGNFAAAGALSDNVDNELCITANGFAIKMGQVAGASQFTLATTGILSIPASLIVGTTETTNSGNVVNTATNAGYCGSGTSTAGMTFTQTTKVTFGVGGTRNNSWLVYLTRGDGAGAIYAMEYSSATVTKIHDPAGVVVAILGADAGTFSLTKGATSKSFVLTKSSAAESVEMNAYVMGSTLATITAVVAA
jgi:hypothetical protein